MPRNNETAIDDVYDAILERARNHPLLRGIPVLDEPDSDGVATAVIQADGTILPYVVITFGERGNLSANEGGIVGVRADSKMLYWGAEVYGPTPRDKRRVAGDVMDIFIGWEPPGAGQIDSPYSGAVENPLEVVRNHVRNGLNLLFRCRTNLELPSDVTGGAIA